MLILRSLPRLWRSARNDIRRHFSMTFSSILSISIALLLCMVMGMLAITTDRIARSVEDQLQLQVSLSPVLDDQGKESLEGQIRDLPDVQQVTYSSKDQELDELIQENGDMFAQYKDANPLYDVFVVELSDPDTLEQTSQEIRQMNGIVEVSYGGAAILNMVGVFQSIRIAGWIMCAVLIFLCIFLIRNTIRMAVMVREDEISIMRTVGAYSSYISMPFLMEGAVMGFWGALIPAVIVGSVYPLFYYAFDGALISELFALYPPIPFLFYVIGADFLLGILLGILGSWMAVQKYLRRTR